MKTKILLLINVDNGSFVGNTIWDDSIFVKNVNFRDVDKVKLIESASIGLKKLMASMGTEYINKHSNDESFVRCPDAFVKLPIDIFCCKHDNESCFIGGRIFKKDQQLFLNNCRVEDKKEGIWNAIVTDKYHGFHHIPGRFLCPSCEQKNSERRTNYNYHYPWELCLVNKLFDKTNKDLIV